MKKNGAQILWECMVHEGVDTVFGITGGKVIPLYHEMPNYPIHHITMRHEQAAAHAAEGYARATGKVGVCISTSGPGATNLVTGIANAYMDSAPMVAITGQVAAIDLGTDAFQEVDTVGITMPITKHNYLVTDIDDLAPTIHEAFYIARTGRPGPVLIDVAVNVQGAQIEFDGPLDGRPDLPGYKPTVTGNKRQIRLAAQMIAQSQRPVIIAGRGVLIARACDELKALAQKADIPVVTTLLGKSAFPEDHALCLGMGGMHGEAYANHAMQSADLIIGIGTRFDDRLTSTAHTFATKAKVIHIDVDPAEIGKRVPTALPIVGDAANVLAQLVPLVTAASHAEWIGQISEWQADTQSRDILLRETDEVLPQYIVNQVFQATDGGAIMVSDVGQNQMWEAQYYRHMVEGGLITSGGLGTMGYALPAAIGAAVGRPDKQVWVVAGDGGFQMTLQELATIVQENLAVKIVILNNGFLGMVRQWQEMFFQRNYAGSPILGPDFALLAQAYGVPGYNVADKADVAGMIKQAYEHDGPFLMNFEIEREENVFPIVPVGKAVDKMIRRPRSEEEEA